MVLAAILAAIATPAISRASSLRASVAANTLYQDILYARERALVTGVTTWIEFSLPDGWSILAEDPASPGRGSATPLLDPATSAPVDRSLDQDHFAGVSLASFTIRSGTSLGFDPLGRPLDDSGSPLSAPAIILFSSDHRLDIAPITGLPTLTAP